MAPSDDDDAPRVPDPGSPDADRSSELPAGPRPRAIEPQRDDGVDPRPSGSVVFDVEVDDPSLVMPRPSRRARPKPAGDAPIEESQTGLAELPEATPDGEDDGADRNGDRHAGDSAAVEAAADDGAADDGVGDDGGDDDGGDDEVAEPPRQLVSGDPLLTGPMPAVRPASRSSKSTTSRPDPAAAADEPDTTSSGKTEAGEEPPSGDQPTTADSSTSTEDSGDAREDASSGEQPARPPLTAKDLFSPVTGEQDAVETDIPPPPPPSVATGSNAPPPPPAPPLTARQTPTGPTPTAPGPIVPAARRAARGSQVTGPIPTTTLPRDASGPIPAPRPTAVAPAPRLAGRRPRVRRVTRVVRHVDPWSVFKVAAVFSFVAYGIALVAGVLLWNVAYATGTVDNIERGLESTGWESFELNGGEIFHNAWIGGLFAAVGLTGLAVLVATLFNLITDLVGGVRMTVLEEEVVEKTASPMRRFSSRQAPGPAPPSRQKRR